ncbi:MAG: autotransporter domain-containing protein, partial [Xanthomonadales bacterium]|nr:autotransporter domain-containing protein [Xanthomonadales bacterium]
QIGGTALAGDDYESLDNPVFVPAGSVEHELLVIPVDDEEIEQNETVQVTVMPGQGYIFATGSAGQAVVNIADDDIEEPPFTGGIAVNPTSGLVTDEDGATAQFTVVLQSPPTDPVSIGMESSDTTEGTINPMALEFNTFNWNTPQTVTVTGQPDDEEDGDQAYTVMVKPAVSNDVNYAGIDPADVSVVNTDTTLPPEPASAQFTQSVYTVEEEEGVAQIFVQRLGNPDVALSVQVSTADNAEGTTATAGEDYTPLSNVDVSWAAGDTEDKMVEITVFENVDTVTGKNETVELLLSGLDMDDQTASLEIVSDIGDDIVGGITDGMLPPNQQDIVSVILDTCPLGGNAVDFQGLCTALVYSAADGNPVSEAIKQTTPDDVAAVRSSGMQTTNVQVTAVDGRLGTLRGGGGAGFSASGFSMNYGEFAMSGDLMKSFITAFDQNNPDFMHNNANQDDSNILDDFGRWGAWISGRVVFGEKDPTTNQVEYDFDTAGITFGLDYRFTDEIVAGVAVGYANTDAKLGQDEGDLDSKGYSVSLYGTWFKSDRFYMGGSLGYGSNDYDHQRNVRYTIERPETGTEFLPDFVFDVDQTLGAEYDGSQFSASLSGGWDFNKKGWTFGPALSVSYVDVDVNDYDEFLLSSNMPQPFASSGWAVHIDDQNYESLQAAIGFAFTKAVSASWGVFIPQGYVDVVSELKDGGTLVTGQFIGDFNDARFALETDDFEETFVRAGLGFGLILKNNKSAYLMVDGDFGRDLLSTYYINAGFRWQF